MNILGSSNGRTGDSGSSNRGSNPCPRVNKNKLQSSFNIIKLLQKKKQSSSFIFASNLLFVQ